MKGVCDVTELLVVQSGVGAQFEAITGTKVEKGVYDKGVDWKPTGAPGVLANQLYGAEGKFKFTNEGFKGNAQARVLDEKVAEANVEKTRRGFTADAGAGFFRSTDFFDVTEAEQVWLQLHKLYVSMPKHVRNAQVLTGLAGLGITQNPVYGFRKNINILFEGLVGISLDKLWDKGLKDFMVLGKVSFFVGTGVGAAAKGGFKEDYKVGNSTLTFEMYGAGGDLGFGVDLFAGYMIKGNYKGRDRAICIMGGTTSVPVTIGCSIIIPYRKTDSKGLEKLFGTVKMLSDCFDSVSAF